MPGLAALNTGGSAAVASVSCPSAGNCAVGGSYTDSSGRQQVFVVDETGGRWGTAQQVPGLAALNSGGVARVTSVSCPSAGNCAAGGSYKDSSGNTQAFVVDETAGSWGTAQQIPGLAALNTGMSAAVSSVSCPSAGNCAASGTYVDSSLNTQVFVVDETGGSWGTAQQVPGLAALNTGGVASVASVSCPSAGNCTAGGAYSDEQAFVADETGGSWGTAQQIPGLAALNTGRSAAVSSVSCPSAGNCAAGGTYTDSSLHPNAFVVDETAGSWGTAQQIPGLAAFNIGMVVNVTSVSCPSAGNCAVGGIYWDPSNHQQTFVADETGGSWSTAQQVPGLAALNTGGVAHLTPLSCESAGNCAVGGDYKDSSGHPEAFLTDETGGSWGTAQQVPGLAALNTGGSAAVASVSCPSAGNCTASGIYTDSSGHTQAFVVDERRVTSTVVSLSAPTVTYGNEQAEHVSGVVSSPGGTPDGTVTVKVKSATVCTITLASGSGACALPTAALPAGTAQLTASYRGNGTFATSAATRSLTIAKAASKTTLTLSLTTITYGKEQAEHLTVTAAPQHGGTPTGKVTVKSGTATVCTITLTAGKGRCALSARQVPKGTHTLIAKYGGSTNFNGSVSAKKNLTVR